MKLSAMRRCTVIRALPRHSMCWRKADLVDRDEAWR